MTGTFVYIRDSVYLELSFSMKKFAVTSGPASSLIIVHKKISIVTLSGGLFFVFASVLEEKSLLRE